MIEVQVLVWRCMALAVTQQKYGGASKRGMQEVAEAEMLGSWVLEANLRGQVFSWRLVQNTRQTHSLYGNVKNGKPTSFDSTSQLALH